MNKILSLPKDVFFKHVPLKKQILFIKMDSTEYSTLELTAVNYDSLIESFFSKKISLLDVQKAMGPKAFAEFQILFQTFEQLGIVESSRKSPKSSLIQAGSSKILHAGEEFRLQFESLPDSGLDLHATVSEGAPCSTLGEVACGTWVPRTYYECISDGTWAGLGTSC